MSPTITRIKSPPDDNMADDEQLPPSWEDITGQLSAMNNRWQTELSAGLHREKNLKQRVVHLEVVVTNNSLFM